MARDMKNNLKNYFLVRALCCEIFRLVQILVNPGQQKVLSNTHGVLRGSRVCRSREIRAWGAEIAVKLGSGLWSIDEDEAFNVAPKEVLQKNRIKAEQGTIEKQTLEHFYGYS
ncbi:hypothetical protein B0H13DRAFT_1873204 [Mycena leptocephala]|nr:hypothetical protein B0H13DRAFT_1873204 [Mycena leptocephala]